MEKQLEKIKENGTKLKEIVRILNTDIKGGSRIYYGLTRIKGVSWSLSNAVCNILNLGKKRKAGTLTDEEIKKIEETIKNIHEKKVPSFILNRPRTLEGKPKHLTGPDLELQIKMDIKLLREIQSYRGIRHALGLPVRGQRTKSHFRHGKTIGVIRKKTKQKIGTKKSSQKK